jgi:uncharacterized membrane protein (DUF106 family)
MAALNAVLRAVFDVALRPFREAPLTGLLLVSLLVAVAMLWVFKRTSDQGALEAVKRQIQACLFEIRLYNDDLRAILRAQLEILRWNGRYVALTIVPLLWLIVPLVLLIAQLEFHYGYRGLGLGETALVEAELKSADGAKPAAALEAPPGIEVQTPPLWIPARREIAWRIRAQSAGEYELKLTVAGVTETKRVVVSEALVRRSPVRVSGLLDQLIYPAEPPLPRSSPIRSIAVSYASRDVEIFGWGLHWMIWFFVLSIVFAFALRRPLGVTL